MGKRHLAAAWRDVYNHINSSLPFLSDTGKSMAHQAATSTSQGPEEGGPSHWWSETTAMSGHGIFTNAVIEGKSNYYPFLQSYIFFPEEEHEIKKLVRQILSGHPWICRAGLLRMWTPVQCHLQSYNVVYRSVQRARSLLVTPEHLNTWW